MGIVEFTETIIQKAEEILGTTLNSSILFSLQDHINFAIHRYEQQLTMESPIQWEISKFYPKEILAGKEEGITMTELRSSFYKKVFLD